MGVCVHACVFTYIAGTSVSVCVWLLDNKST